MKKVGIMSMQRIANYGSFLQAYGLKHILEELGCDVQFIDYHPGKTIIPSDEGTGIKRKINKLLETFKYDASFIDKIKFIKYKKNYAKKYYPYLGLKEMNYDPQIDLLVIGSDEVFNCVQNNTNVGFSSDLFGVNSNAKKIITYAASFGNTTIDKLKKYKIDNIVSSYIDKIDTISVRDENSGSIVRALTGKEPLYNLDPVLIYDYIGKCKEIPKNVSENKYMILYGYSGRFEKTECDMIKKFAKKRGLKIFCIGGVQDACDKFIDCNPFEVIAYFQHADYIVTDTFHGTILSIITHRQFITITRNKGYGNVEKITDLLIRLKLSSRALDILNNLEDKMELLVDYDLVDRIINNERDRSYKYLREEILN